jgi:HEPN domain-containing protein
MRNRERASVLLRKANEDEFTVEKLLPDPASSDEIIGFHAQQAVEKNLKAILAMHGVDYPFIHDLLALLELLRVHKIPFPQELEEVRLLTPFATMLRYEELPTDPRHALDRAWALNCIRKVRAWAESILAGQPGG